MRTARIHDTLNTLIEGFIHITMSMIVETKITFANELGNKLTGLLVRPASWEGGSGSLQGRTRGKVIVLLHGL